MCAGQLPTALVEQLQQVPTNQENQQNEQDDIEIDQQNKNNVADQTFAVAELWRAARTGDVYAPPSDFRGPGLPYSLALLMSATKTMQIYHHQQSFTILHLSRLR